MIKLPDFILIPYQLLEDKKISLIDERLYGIIYWFTKLKNEKCTASNKTLAELVKTTAGTIQNSLTKLEELEYIKRLFKDENKKIRKEIIPLVVFSKVSFKDDKVSPSNDKVSPTDDTRYHPPVNRIRIYNKNSKKDIVADATEWSFKEEIKKIIEGERKDLKIIVLYWIKKGINFENKEQFQKNLKRELRPANDLIGYSKPQIEQAMDYCEKEYKVWTLETTFKRIGDLINKI